MILALAIVGSLLGALALGAAVLQLLAWRAERRGIAGASGGGRGAQVGALVLRRFFRRRWLRMRQLVASAEQKQKLHDQYHLASATEAVQVLGNMKGVFMKLGQIVSFANDALPPEAQAAMRALQRDAPPMAFALARGVVEEELGGDLGRHFAEFDEEPLAAASIGQVHRARLKSGEEVAVKVQYPGVDKAIEGDLAATDGLAGVIDTFNKTADMKAVIAELKERMLEELDYSLEAQNQQLFYDLWEGHPLIRIPRPHLALSRKRVLVQEFRRGFGFYDFLREADAREKKRASYVIGDFVFESMFRFLAYNGDPHPGNYLFHEDGGVTFLDFGCVKYFRPSFMVDLKRFFRAIIEDDRATHDVYVHKIGLVLPGQQLEDHMWQMWRYHLEPYSYDGEFVVTPDYVARARDVMAPDKVRRFNLPPDLLFFLRITFGLNAISQQLGAAGNYHRTSRRYFFDENEGPSLSQLGTALPARFLDPTVQPVARALALDAPATATRSA